MTAMDDLNALLAPLPGYALLTPSMKQTALDGALMPDSAGVWSGQDGYITTYDVYWAAVSLIGFLQAQPVVRQSSSEGTSIAVEAPNWSGILAYYRGASPIAGATGNDVLRIISIPGSPHILPTDMSGRGGGPYDDVDTDLG